MYYEVMYEVPPTSPIERISVAQLVETKSGKNNGMWYILIEHENIDDTTFAPKLFNTAAEALKFALEYVQAKNLTIIPQQGYISDLITGVQS